MKVAGMRAATCCAVMVVASALAVPQADAAARALDMKHVEQLDKRFEPIREAAFTDNLDGRPEQALARLRGAVDESDWMALFALGNNLWTMYPEQSFAWHQRAWTLSDGNHYVLFELALHYTRHGQCDKAIEAWQTLDKAGLLGGHMPMIAGYCHLQLGQDAQAFALFDRAQSRHGAFEALLKELWGGPHPVIVHAQRLAAFNASGNPDDLDAALANVIKLDAGKDRGHALLAITDAAVRADSATLAAPLACLRPVFAQDAGKAEAADATSTKPGKSSRKDAELQALLASIDARKGRPDTWKEHLLACGLVLDGHPLPENPVLMKFLVTMALDMQIATHQVLLAAHGPALTARARSGRGDRDALEVLAALQANTSDPGLKDSDMLGWERYALADFAASGIHGEMVDGTLSAHGRTLLQRAHAQFPRDARILLLWLRHGDPDEDAARDGWRELTLLQFHTPTIERDELHVQPLARTLYIALQEYRKAVGIKSP